MGTRLEAMAELGVLRGQLCIDRLKARPVCAACSVVVLSMLSLLLLGVIASTGDQSYSVWATEPSRSAEVVLTNSEDEEVEEIPFSASAKIPKLEDEEEEVEEEVGKPSSIYAAAKFPSARAQEEGLKLASPTVTKLKGLTADPDGEDEDEDWVKPSLQRVTATSRPQATPSTRRTTKPIRARKRTTSKLGPGGRASTSTALAKPVTTQTTAFSSSLRSTSKASPTRNEDEDADEEEEDSIDVSPLPTVAAAVTSRPSSTLARSSLKDGDAKEEDEEDEEVTTTVFRGTMTSRSKAETTTAKNALPAAREDEEEEEEEEEEELGKLQTANTEATPKVLRGSTTSRSNAATTPAKNALPAASEDEEEEEEGKEAEIGKPQAANTEAKTSSAKAGDTAKPSVTLSAKAAGTLQSSTTEEALSSSSSNPRNHGLAGKGEAKDVEALSRPAREEEDEDEEAAVAKGSNEQDYSTIVSSTSAAKERAATSAEDSEAGEVEEGGMAATPPSTAVSHSTVSSATTLVPEEVQRSTTEHAQGLSADGVKENQAGKKHDEDNEEESALSYSSSVSGASTTVSPVLSGKTQSAAPRSDGRTSVRAGAEAPSAEVPELKEVSRLSKKDRKKSSLRKGQNEEEKEDSKRSKKAKRKGGD